MKVELLNKDEVADLFEHYGRTASVCYDTKTNTPEKIGRHCMNSGHFSGSRSRYFEFLITDCPRFTIDQAVRHEIGVCKNVQSFRYVDKHSFMYEVPVEIIDNDELLNKYNQHMISTIELYTDIQSYVLEKTHSNERANEQARYVLPMSTHSAFVYCLDIEALIHLMNKRLCTRTEDVFRQLAILMKNEVLTVLPELRDKLVPQCVDLMWCPEDKSCCGIYPTKEQLKEEIKKLNIQKGNNISCQN